MEFWSGGNGAGGGRVRDRLVALWVVGMGRGAEGCVGGGVLGLGEHSDRLSTG